LVTWSEWRGGERIGMQMGGREMNNKLLNWGAVRIAKAGQADFKNPGRRPIGKIGIVKKKTCTLTESVRAVREEVSPGRPQRCQKHVGRATPDGSL